MVKVNGLLFIFTKFQESKFLTERNKALKSYPDLISYYKSSSLVKSYPRLNKSNWNSFIAFLQLNLLYKDVTCKYRQFHGDIMFERAHDILLSSKRL
jgi:hypothetical protein